jgi:hypothetical protein
MTAIYDDGRLLGDTGGPAAPVPFPLWVDVPVVLTSGVLSPTARVGDVLQCTLGNWTNMGEGPHEYSFQWYVDNSLRAGQIGNSYTVVQGDAGRDIHCRVTARNYFDYITAPMSNIVHVAGQCQPPRHNRPPVSG